MIFLKKEFMKDFVAEYFTTDNYFRIKNDQRIMNDLFDKWLVKNEYAKNNESNKKFENKCTFTHDKYNWWIIIERENSILNIPIIFNRDIEKQINYLYDLYKSIGYIVTIDDDFYKTY